MAIQFVEGQTLSAKYSLLHRILENDRVDCWLAVDDDLNQRVFLKIFKQSLSGDLKQSISQNLERQRGLIHERIARTYGMDRFEEFDFIAAQYIQSGRSFSHEGSFEHQWAILRQVADAIKFAHSLGFSHGKLHANNILVDAEGNVFITDFALSAVNAAANAAANDEHMSGYLSPQIKAQHPVDKSDDMYTFGQLIYKSLTGNHWQEGQDFESDLPIPDSFQQLLTGMLQESPYNRPVDLSTVIDVVDDYVSGSPDTIDIIPTSFRTMSEPETAAAVISHKLPRERNTVSTSIAAAGFVLLLTVALLVFLFLPETDPITITSTRVETTSVTPSTTEARSTAEEPTLTPLEIARLKKLEIQGAEIATEILRLELEVEDVGGQFWAAEAYNGALALGAEGDDAYRIKDYQLAFDKYQNGITLLSSVLADMDSKFADNQALGNQALRDGDANLALEAFTILNAIKRGDTEIQTNLVRAENLAEVLSLVRDGEVIERNGDLPLALTTFQNAFRIDGLWQPAAEAVDRVKQKIANKKFNDQMSIAFTALSRKSYDEARLAFEAAQVILPETNEPKDGLQQVTIAKTQNRIETHYVTSAEHRTDEDWAKATVEFEAILALSPGEAEAVDGLQNALDRITLEGEMSEYISEPSVMVEDDSLRDAKGVLLRAAAIEDTGPKLQDQINQLSHLISLARIPIEIELKSDNKTDVTVYKVGVFGKLRSTRLTLIPGTYTFVGTRRGYRDVHREVILQGGRPAPSILISCIEKI